MQQPPKGGFLLEKIKKGVNMSKELDFIRSAHELIVAQQPFVENGVGHKTIIGFNRKGDGSERGVYTYHEITDSEGTKQILVQDTMLPCPVRGVIIKDGKIIDSVGFDGLPPEKLMEGARALFSAFGGCDKYGSVNKI
ncbi:MAG: hypothetical protein Q7R31_02205 [Candidatus Levybacteria bacterium]|nr:hypothetical protein [Candidatus Levybacteria bacterium]